MGNNGGRPVGDDCAIPGGVLMRYVCRECGQEQTGETDCLKHAQKYGHEWFIDREDGGSWYRPEADVELLGGEGE